MFGFVASTTSVISPARDPAQQLVDPQVLGLDAVERRERAAEHVVEAAVLVRALERDHVDRLLDDADDGAVAARVEADRAELLLGQVAALAAEADALLDLLDRVRERDAPRPSASRGCGTRAAAPSAIPIPGSRVSCATRLSTEGLSTQQPTRLFRTSCLAQARSTLAEAKVDVRLGLPDQVGSGGRGLLSNGSCRKGASRSPEPR